MAEQDIQVPPQEELDEELAEGRETPEESETRKARRRSRIKEFEERTKRAEEQNRIISEQMAQMTTTLGKIVESQMAREKAATHEEDPVEQLRKTREEHWAMYGALQNPTAQQARAALDRDRELEKQILSIEVEKAVKKIVPKQSDRGSTLVELVKEANPDVFSDQRAHKYVGALYQVAIEGGDKVGPKELNEMVEQARRKFGINPSPTDADRSRYSSHGSMVPGNQPQDSTSYIDFNDPGTKKMIRAYGARYGISDDTKATEHWIKNVGKKLNKK